jgi:K+-transporting ATPase KdpF subunit
LEKGYLPAPPNIVYYLSYIRGCLGVAGSDILDSPFSGDATMPVIYWIGSIIALFLFVYLLVALLKPETFS